MCCSKESLVKSDTSVNLIKSEPKFRTEVDKGMSQPFSWMEEGSLFLLCFLNFIYNVLE